MQRGLAGGIIRGGIRDAEEIETLEFFLAAAHVTPLTGKGRIRYAERAATLQWGGIRISPGDWAMADRTGIVVFPAETAPELARRAGEMEAADRQFGRLLDQGLGFEDALRQVRHF